MWKACGMEDLWSGSLAYLTQLVLSSDVSGLDQVLYTSAPLP